MVQKIYAFALMVLLLSGVATVGSALFAGANFRPPPYPRAIITSDGSITPLAVPIQRNGDVYSLTANMSRYALEVERDNIILDGAGHSFTGNSYETGITLKGRSNVTIRNIEFVSFGHAIYLGRSSNNTIIKNSFRNDGTGSGIRLADQSKNNVILDNYMYGNNDGVAFLDSGNNTLRSNAFWYGWQSININAVANNPLASYFNDVDSSNTVNGKPIYYWLNQHDRTMPEDAGFVALINCTRVTVQNLNVSDHCESGILLVATTNSQVTGNRVTYNTNGITLALGSNYNVIDQNVITRNENSGIIVRESHYNEFNANNITGDGGFGNRRGIELIRSQGNIITGNLLSENRAENIKLDGSSATIKQNKLTNSSHGISLVTSSNSLITQNMIAYNSNGVTVADSSNNRIEANNITKNRHWGIELDGSQKDNVIVANNFVDNNEREGLQVSMPGYGSINLANPDVWDENGEGNYWSDYFERYPNASESGTSGTGDTPYVINENNADNHPLTEAYITPDESPNMQLSMPQEYLNYTITAKKGRLWAKIDGVYPMHLSGADGNLQLPMVYPTPPETTNLHVYLDDAELSWSNYSDIDPTATHYTDLGDWQMIYAIVTPEEPDFVLRIHYEHPLQDVNGTYMFLYDLNISPYLSTETPKSTAHFNVRIEAEHTAVNVFMTGFDGNWSPLSLNSTKNDNAETVQFDIISEYGKSLLGDIVVAVPQSPAQEPSLAWMAFPVAAVTVAGCLIVFVFYWRTHQRNRESIKSRHDKC